MSRLQGKIDQLHELGEKAGYVIASFGLEIQEKDKVIAKLEAQNLGLIQSLRELEAENAKLEAALQEIADSIHLGNRWAKYKAKEAMANYLEGKGDD